MTVSGFISMIEQHKPGLPDDAALETVAYKWNSLEDWGESDDENAAFRESVTEALYTKYDDGHRQIIRFLLRAEIDYCDEETMLTDVLRRLSFMLYELGHAEDADLLYEAKYGTSFDATCGLDAELVRGKAPAKVLAWCREQEMPDEKLAGILEELNVPNSGLMSPEAFTDMMRKRLSPDENTA